MRVDVSPDVLDVIPGHGATMVVTVTNTETIIGGYAVRVLGADPGWVTLSEDTLSLFPDEARAITVQVTPPEGLVAGTRRLAIQVRELTEPYSSSVADVDLVVPAVPKTDMNVDPVVVNAGKQGTFSLLVENTGNTDMHGWLSGDDEESAVTFAFEPDEVSLAPGQHAVVEMRARAKRPFFGSPAVRSLEVFLDDTPPSASPLPKGASDGDEPEDGSSADRKSLAGATLIQKPVMARGALGLVGLMVAATVFALIISLALGKLVSQSAADRNLALQVAAAQDKDANGGGSSGVSGTVRSLTSGAGENAITVTVYEVADTSNAVASTTTAKDGTYALNGLAAGQYKLRYSGAGFQPLWYPGALSADDATAVALSPGKVLQNQNVTIGGVPAKISGSVSGDDVGAATLYLESGGTTAAGTGAGTGAGTNAATRTPAQTPAGAAAPPSAGAVVQQIPIGSDGTFTLSNVPSPSVYQLVVVKAGYATATQQVDVGAGEDRKGVQISLVKGDGLISGSVSGDGRKLGAVSIVATSGSSTASTVSVDGTGAFTLRTLATPATYTVVATRPGYGSQTLSLGLTAGQHLTGVDITLSKSTGTVTGIVTLVAGGTVDVPLPQAGAPGSGPEGPSNGLGGVSVTVTDGKTTRQTVTTSAGTIGAWSLVGLPVPGTYTATFSRSDLETQTIALSIDAQGAVDYGAGTVSSGTGVPVAMRSATGIVSGYIKQVGGIGVCDKTNDRLGEATVVLTSGSSTYTVTSASAGRSIGLGGEISDCGRYVFEDIPPGSYTLTASTSSGTTPTSRSVTVVAGQVVPYSITNIELPSPASVSGTVSYTSTTANGTKTSGPLPNWTVFLYQRDGYPGTVYRQGLTKTVRLADGTRAARYTITDIEAGSYVVAVSPTGDPDDAVQTKRVVVLPSKVAPASFVVKR